MAMNNLPVPLTRFIGRDEEINEMLRLSVQTRLLTLTGSGGCGKTRLALEVATRLGDSFERNVAWVELAPLAHAALVQQTVAQILDVPESSDQPITRSVANYLRPRNFLLVLDNCEHLIDACAQLVEELLRTCPHLLILATSREALNISGETAWRVPPLQVIDPRTTATWEPLLASESARLFIERARSVEYNFVGDQQNARAIAQICHRLDGMPLAIELAAARVKALPVEQIAARLDDRFRFLNLGTRTAPPRHQTLRAVIDWSYDLLSPAEKILFHRLAVFAGGWTLEAAEVVCSGEGLASYAILDLVEHLVDKSVVVAQNKVARYHLLETIRQYGHEKLLESAEAETIHQRHLEWLIQFAKEADPKLRGTEMNIWARRLDAELDNIRTALEWGFEHAQISNVAELVAALDYYFFLRGNYGEAKRWAERAAQLTRGAPADIHAKALFAWGFMLGRLGDSESAEPVLQQALALYRASDNPERVAYILNLLGVIASFRDNIDQAEQYFQESLTLRRAIGDKWGIAHTLQNFGLLAEKRGDYAGAKAIYEQVLELSEELGDERMIARRLADLGGIAYSQGDLRRADTMLRRAVSALRDMGEKFSLFESVVRYVQVMVAEGQPDRAALMIGAMKFALEELGMQLSNAGRANLEKTIDIIRRQLGEDELAGALGKGRAMSLEQVIDFVLAESQSPDGSDVPASAVSPRQVAKARLGGLTTREREVAALIAQGKSNREIAEQLVLAERTIEGHVGNILGKLGFTSRTQIATWAMQKGLERNNTKV